MIGFDVIPDQAFGVHPFQQQKRAGKHLEEEILRDQFTAVALLGKHGSDRPALNFLADHEKIG